MRFQVTHLGARSVAFRFEDASFTQGSGHGGGKILLRFLSIPWKSWKLPSFIGWLIYEFHQFF